MKYVCKKHKTTEFRILKIASFKTSYPDSVGVNWPNHDHLSETGIE